MLDKRKAEAQQVLDDLWSKEMIPFALSIGQITGASDECTLHFFDSRISTAYVAFVKGQSFGDGVRAAVLDRVAKMSGPLANWRASSG